MLTRLWDGGTANKQADACERFLRAGPFLFMPDIRDSAALNTALRRGDNGGAMTDDSTQRPEDVRFLSGLILVSEQPERLADFYRDVLGLPLAEERHGDTALHWACELGDVHFAIHPVADYEGEPTATGAVKLAFMIFDMDGLAQWLETHDVPLCYPPAELGTESRITAIRDPDGNPIELTELGPAWLDHLKEHRAAGGDLLQVWQTRLSG